jgi:adenylate cyclase
MTEGDVAVQEYLGAILFTDLVGFTEFTDGVGDLEALGVLEAQREIVEGVLEDVSGARVVKELGDGLMIWVPSATEGLRTAAEVMSLIEDERTAGDFPLAVRMGMHYGNALARGDDLVGQSVNIAARVSDLAGPGELLVSEELVGEFSGDLVEFEMHPVGPVRVRGVQTPVWLHRLSF